MPDTTAALLRRQKALADFGDFALQSEDLDAVLHEACRLVAEALGTGRAKVLEIEKGGEGLLVRAGVGWAPGVVGLRLPMDERSSEAFSIEAGEPVISRDVRGEDRFEVPAFMADAGVRALANAPIFLPGRRAYGLLEVDNTEPRDFGEADTGFLRTYAAILGPVIDRLFKLDELRGAEERFRLTVETATDYAILVTDAEGRIADWLPGAEAVFGWGAEEVVGQPAAVLFTPEDRAAGEDRKELETARAQGHAPDVRWHLCRDGGRVFIDGAVWALHDAQGRADGFLKIGQDVTARREADERLRASEERQAFLLRFSDALRPLADPAAIQGEAVRRLREHLDAGWCYYVEWDETGTIGSVLRDSTREGLPSMVGVHDVSGVPEFTDLLRSGRVLDVSDFSTFPRFNPRVVERYTSIGIHSVLGPSLVKDGRLVATLSLADTRPRNWSEDDVALLQEAAERTWAAVERARVEQALRESEERLRLVGRATNDAVMDWDLRTDRIVWNEAIRTVFGHDEGARAVPARWWRDRIHPEDRDRVLCGLDAALAGDAEQWAGEYRFARADGAFAQVIDRGLILRDRGRAVRIVGSLLDVTNVRRAEAAAVKSEAALRLTASRLRSLVEGIPQLVWRSGDGGRWSWASPQWMAFTGLSAEGSRGLGWLDALHPDDREGAMAAWREADATGRLDAEHRIRRASDGTHRWFTTRAAPVRDPATGARVEWLGTSTDVQDLKEMGERQQVLVAELQHRTRNLVGVVRAVSERTAAAAGSLDAYRARFRARLDALARVQGLLSRLGEGERVAFDELLRAELAAHGAADAGGRGRQVGLDGPSGVRLRSSTVQTLALALHELATNALKHGALAGPEGRLLVRWRLLRDGDGGGGGPRLRVEWIETGVPMPEPGASPRGGGYGRELIERALPYQLGAETSYELAPDGVRCTITLPVSAATERAEARLGA